MVNLYQLLEIVPTASVSEIRVALMAKREVLEPRVVQAVHEWLLVPDVRVRYDARLQQEQPEFFQMFFVVENEQVVYRLWQPEIILILALLFSPAFGAWLIALNWRELGEDEDAKYNLYVAYGWMVLALLMWIMSGITGVFLPIWVTVGVAVGLWGVWCWVLGREQWQFVRDELDGDYEYKSWVKPIVGLVVGMAVYLLVGAVILFVLQMLGILHPSFLHAQ